MAKAEIQYFPRGSIYLKFKTIEKTDGKSQNKVVGIWLNKMASKAISGYPESVIKKMLKDKFPTITVTDEEFKAAIDRKLNMKVLFTTKSEYISYVQGADKAVDSYKVEALTGELETVQAEKNSLQEEIAKLKAQLKQGNK